jgi:glycosyltransferase involved in cell wall biosynthesis
MRICLSMIVKNEAPVIERCLASVRPYIHAWAISDTGSTDGTQDIVRQCVADLPGALIERPWLDFSSNRNQALELARQYGDYALIIDADDVLEADTGFAWPALTAPGYLLEIVYNQLRYRRVVLPRLDADWEWKGVLHEALVSPHLAQAQFLPGLRIRIHNDGARSRQSQVEKFTRDAQVLRAALDKESDNARYRFYLAQSLRDAGDTAGAIAEYEKRVAMGGWAEETYFSRLQVAVLKERLGAAYAEVVAAYLDACDCRPARAEAPCELARYFRMHQRWNLARHFAQIAASLPIPDDVLFIDRAVHDWRARDELAIAAYWCGDFTHSAALCRELLADARLPASERERVQKNLEFSLPHLTASA